MYFKDANDALTYNPFDILWLIRTFNSTNDT